MKQVSDFYLQYCPVRTTYMYNCGPVSGKDVSEPSPAMKVGRGNAMRERWTDQPSILRTANYGAPLMANRHNPGTSPNTMAIYNVTTCAGSICISTCCLYMAMVLGRLPSKCTVLGLWRFAINGAPYELETLGLMTERKRRRVDLLRNAPCLMLIGSARRKDSEAQSSCC